MKKTSICLLLLIAVLLNACEQKHFYSQYQPVPGLKWTAADTFRFSIDIPETRNYYLAFSVRHRKDYEFSNLWLMIRLKGPQTDTSFRQELQLFNIEGRPFGKCSGSTCTQTIPLKNDQLELFKGKYTLQVLQLMRKDPLEGVEDIGVILDLP